MMKHSLLVLILLPIIIAGSTEKPICEILKGIAQGAALSRSSEASASKICETAFKLWAEILELSGNAGVIGDLLDDMVTFEEETSKLSDSFNFPRFSTTSPPS